MENEKIEFEFTMEDFNRASSFYNTRNCALATLGKKLFPDRHIRGGSDQFWAFTLEQYENYSQNWDNAHYKVTFNGYVRIDQIYARPMVYLPIKGYATKR